MIRPIAPDDTETLLQLTAATGVFKPMEVDTLREVLEDFHATNHQQGHRAFLMEIDSQIVGYAYHAPATMTDRSWYLYWIAVDPKQQGKGIGTELLCWTEDDIRQQGGRVLFIETSSLPQYTPTRQFYLKHGYELTAQLKDFYADGDDMVVFRKRLNVG